MGNTLIYSTRSLLGIIHKTRIQQMKMIWSNFDNIDLLSTNKTDKLQHHIENVTGMNIRYHKSYFLEAYEEIKHMSSWAEVYENLDVSCLKQYDRLIICGGMFSPGSYLKRGTDRNFTFPYDSGQMKFVSVGKYILNIIALLKAHREYGIPLHEIIGDPLEMSCNLFHHHYAPKSNYYLYHGYDIPRYGVIRLDNSQYFFNSQNPYFRPKVDKTLDFTFGYTIITHERDKFMGDVLELNKKFGTASLYIRDKDNNIDTFVDRDIYLNKIAASKYTMILPAYDTTSFSVYRLIESLAHDCLPLIHSACNLSEISPSFDVDLSLIVSDEPFSERRRVELLEYMQQKIMVVEKEFMI